MSEDKSPDPTPPLKNCLRCGEDLAEGLDIKHVICQHAIGYHIECFKEHRKEYKKKGLPDGYSPEIKRNGDVNWKMYQDKRW